MQEIKKPGLTGGDTELKKHLWQETEKLNRILAELDRRIKKLEEKN